VSEQPPPPPKPEPPPNRRTAEAPPTPAGEPSPKLAQQGYDLLKTYCYRCHGIDFKVPGYNVLDRPGLLAARRRGQAPYVVPGKPDESLLWQRVAVDEDMPPSGAKPSDAERAVLKKWIEAGAPFPGRDKRPFVGDADILTAIRDHLGRTAPADRRFQRYFTLTHLSNNERVTADELRLYRAALAKVANSLSWKQGLVVPRAVDRDETVFAVDLRDLGWDAPDRWKEVVKVYPYGLTHTGARDEALRKLAGEVADLAGCDLPFLRADWFVATASRPPLYHTLLDLPKDARELERQLKVDVRGDFLRNKLARAGFITSGVSKQNRLVDRHDAVYGAYWKSYDFKTNEGTGNLLKFPLGPAFDENPFPKQAFVQAGGEIIFNLPNGLQGYLLVNGKDGRIDEGPIEVVRDVQETSGSPAVVNGLSCMACHKHGVIRFEDKVREGSAVGGEALVKVQELFRTKEAMDRLLDRDEERFVRALEEATGPFLQTGEDRDRKIREFAEPVGAAARLYVRDLGVEEAALELGIEDPHKLKALIEGNPTLRKLGLGPLANGGTIKRDVWSSLEFTTSLFHNVAQELGLGTPHVSF
jgi:serine/threonine-protein kinase